MSFTPLSHSTIEVASMTDDELLDAFERITGHSHLFCKHCRAAKPIRTHFRDAIRSRCSKRVGLCSTMQLPKSCDKQMALNKKHNPINNPIYGALRRMKTEDTPPPATIKIRRAAPEPTIKSVLDELNDLCSSLVGRLEK